VIFPVGYRNRFGHPFPEVLDRYLDGGARIHRTDQAGAVTVNFAVAGVDIVHEREQRRRYWHNPGFVYRESSP
jgi:competence protein ComEC